ncbi:MAG TPA: 4'-phosphopantetheinyl transferase superfamily protein, partial [Humidesulfovibrio sp.]|uniref:4'-phosphopantetheinyl transferase family protein n=1 Tax=Humidesulfovibrio sp. TaxID=2910988 RepID=UPI002BECDE7D
ARHLLGRALVRRVLGAAFGRPFSGEFALGPWGKPACPPEWLGSGNAMDFSISHSGRMVWAAFCRAAAVGIDVEQIRPLPEAFDLAAQLHPLECAAVRAQPEPDRAVAFHRCWTRKEAVLKALGMGLNLPLQGFLVRPDPGDADWLVSLPGQTGQGTSAPAWTTRDIDAGPGYQCSVAADAPNLSFAVFFQ